MQNSDLVALTEIKLYLLEPPISFKLGSHAIQKINEAMTILARYQLRDELLTGFLEHLKMAIEQNQLQGTALRKELVQAGRMIGDLNNR